MVPFHHLGNGNGDACEMDRDGDGVLDAVDSDGDKVFDSMDNAPANKLISRTDFTRYMSVPLSSGSRPISPRWTVHGNVRIPSPNRFLLITRSGEGILIKIANLLTH